MASEVPFPRELPTLARTARRWSIAITDPLLPAMDRLQIELSVVDQFRANPDWMSTLAAGLLSDLVLTLPADDPWRHLSARIAVEGGPDLTRGDIPAPPPRTGAVTAGSQGPREFGTHADEEDRLPRIAREPGDDPGVAAVERRLAPDAAALIAFAADGWEAAKSAIGEIYRQARHRREEHWETSQSAADDPALWDASISGRAAGEAAIAAILWACHRRRTYSYAGTGSFVLLSTDRWVSRANTVRSAGGLGADERQVIATQIESQTQASDAEMLDSIGDAGQDETDESAPSATVHQLRRPGPGA